MNKTANFDKDLYTAKKRIASWSTHSDPFMVVLSQDTRFLALEVIVAYLSCYKDGSKRNAFLAAHGWVKTFLNHRSGSEAKVLSGLTSYLSNHPRQCALLLESEHIFITQEDRETRLRKAYGYFLERGAKDILVAIEGYLNAVSLRLADLRYEEDKRRAKKRKRLERLRAVVDRVRAIKARRDYLKIVETARDLLGLNAKAVGAFHGIDVRHWRYLVAPLE